jgi:hypothetical protein
MGGDLEYTKTDLRQIERDQQDPKFLEWLAGMDDGLATFFADDVPDMPENPFSAEGLRHAEEVAIRWFWRRNPIDREWPERELRFQRFVGETLIRSFEGRWKYIDMRGHGHFPVVSLPSNPLYYELDLLVDQAVTKKSGEAWARIFGYAAEDHADWVAAGRLPPREWEKYRLQRDLERL